MAIVIYSGAICFTEVILGLGTDEDALANLLMAWYYSGYYTGRYQALQEAQRASEDSNTTEE